MFGVTTLHRYTSISRRSAAREAAFAKCLLGAGLLGQKNYKDAGPLLLEGALTLSIITSRKEAAGVEDSDCSDSRVQN
jgi:hypothetical protein